MARQQIAAAAAATESNTVDADDPAAMFPMLPRGGREYSYSFLVLRQPCPARRIRLDLLARAELLGTPAAINNSHLDLSEPFGSSSSTCPPLSPSPHANSFVIGTAVINTHNNNMTFEHAHHNMTQAIKSHREPV